MLSREEFLYALDSIDDQAQLTEDQKSTIMDKADKNRDNQITLKEFKDFLMQSVDFGLPQKKVT
jgi:DNA-directed RNA polymerase specialized sigma subunit